MAHITRWTNIGQTFNTTFDGLAGNKSGIEASYFKASQQINYDALKPDWNYIIGENPTISHEIAYAVQNVQITGYIQWKSGGISNEVTSPDIFSSYEPATRINLTTSVSEVYSDYSGKIYLTATVNGSRSSSNAPVIFTSQDKNVGSSVINTSYGVEISKLESMGWTSDQTTKSYFFGVQLAGAAYNSAEPTLGPNVVSNKGLQTSESITVKVAVKNITVGDYNIHINAKDLYETTYTLVPHGNAGTPYSNTVSCSISNSSVANVSVNGGKLLITGKDISNSATKFSSATITLKSTCTSKSGGVTNGQAITLYVYDNTILIVNINTGDKYTATLISVQQTNEPLDKLPTIKAVSSLNSTDEITPTIASVGDVYQLKGSDNKYYCKVEFTAIKEGIQYFLVSNGSYITVNVSDINLILS